MKKLELVACICTNGAIGKNGKQVYYIKEDLRHFKNLTTGGIVIMGHKTQNDLPIGYLPNRVNIVMTRDNDLLKGEKYVAWEEGYYVNGVDNLEKLLDEKFADVTVPIFVIGGQQVYESLLKYVYKIHLTVIYDHPEGCDTFLFLPKEEFDMIESTCWVQDFDNNVAFRFETYERVNKC